MYCKALAATVVAFAVLSAAASASASTNLISNGDFEDGDGIGSLTGWTVGGAAAVVAATSAEYAACCSFSGASDGTFAAFGGSGQAGITTLTQNFTTIAGRFYTLNFDFGAVGSGNSNLLSVTADTGFESYSASGTNDFANAYIPRTINFVGSGGVHALTFAVTTYPDDNVDSLVDNVSLTLGAVPEPSAWALMILGFGGVGASLRTRRRATAATA